MSDERVRIGMTPPHPGSFIRTEILDELGLSSLAPPTFSVYAA